MLNMSYTEISSAEIDAEGKKKLAESSVLIIGAGGLGSPSAMYLTAAGIGTLGIADGDTVSISNLHRQILHRPDRNGILKVKSAEKTLKDINSDINIITYPYFLNDENIIDVIKKYDFIIDASDRIENKFLINDACVLAEKPFSHAGILKYGGQIMTCIPHKSACLRCILEDIPENSMPTCASAGIVGMTCGVAGSIQATEAIKYITGAGEILTNKLLSFDILSMEFRKISFTQHSPYCRICGENPNIENLSWYKKYYNNSCKIKG